MGKNRVEGIVWETEKVLDLLRIHGRCFARIATPRGWRTGGKKFLLPKGKSKLEGNCFAVSLALATTRPDKLYYCEGFADGLPHAWVSPKCIKDQVLDEDWAIDLTWPWFHYSKVTGKRIVHENAFYVGLRLDPLVCKEFLLTRLAKMGEGSTGCSMLKYYEEIQHLLE